MTREGRVVERDGENRAPDASYIKARNLVRAEKGAIDRLGSVYEERTSRNPALKDRDNVAHKTSPFG